MIYRGKGVVFLTAVKVRDIVSVGARPVFTEQKRFTTQLLSLSLSPALFFLCLSLYLSSVCGPQGSLQLERSVGLEWMRGWSVWRRLLWSEVHHWPIPPPASTLAARCSPGKGPYPLLPIPSCLWRNAPGPRTLKMRPLFLFCLFFFNFLIHSFEHSRRFLCVLVSLYGSLLLAQHNIC